MIRYSGIMTIFWLMTGLLTALAGLLVLGGARRAAGRTTDVDQGEVDRLAGARELAELDRLKARGLMDEAAWSAARAEAGRRILAAHRAERQLSVGSRDRVIVLAGIGVCALMALGLYLGLGRPGLADQSYAARVSEWAASPDTLEPAQVAAVMARVVQERPEDPVALGMLGTARFEAGDPIAAASAFRRALALQPDNAQNWARLGESLVRANEGQISGDAEAAFVEAVRLDDNQLGAHFFLGDVALQRGDLAAARRHWAPLLDVLAPSDPRRAELSAALAKAAEGQPAEGKV